MSDVVPIYHSGWCLTGLMVSIVINVARFFEVLMSGKLLNSAQLWGYDHVGPKPAAPLAAWCGIIQPRTRISGSGGSSHANIKPRARLSSSGCGRLLVAYPGLPPTSHVQLRQRV
jgi:hypothetical protein